jgi:hypothetical protein
MVIDREDDKVALIRMKLTHLSVARDRDSYLRGLVDLCSQAVDAERCTVYVVDQQRHELRAKVAQRTQTEIDRAGSRGSGRAHRRDDQRA